MATSDTAAVASAPVIEVTLEEFCVRLSSSDRRVELINAFHFTEKKAGRLKDTESNYRAQYMAFINKPV